MQVWGILGGGAIMLSLAMGMRQSFGLLQPHMIRDIGITAADFSLAVALQNIVWGATQPIVGCLLYTSPSPRDGLLSRMPSSA